MKTRRKVERRGESGGEETESSERVSVGGNARLRTERAEADCSQQHTADHLQHQPVFTLPLCCSDAICEVAETSPSWSAFLRITGNASGNIPASKTGVDRWKKRERRASICKHKYVIKQNIKNVSLLYVYLLQTLSRRS